MDNAGYTDADVLGQFRRQPQSKHSRFGRFLVGGKLAGKFRNQHGTYAPPILIESRPDSVLLTAWSVDFSPLLCLHFDPKMVALT